MQKDQIIDLAVEALPYIAVGVVMAIGLFLNHKIEVNQMRKMFQASQGW